MEKKKKKGRLRAFLRYTLFTLMSLILIGVTTAAICGMVFAMYINKYINPEIDVDLDSVRLNLTSFVYYVDKETGEEKELETLHGVENRVWADISEIPKTLQNAFIAVEDARFSTHHGVDWKRTLGAAANFVLKFRDNFGGGSTITQQLIKNITGEDDTSVKRKIQEIMRALALEEKYEKEDILELYLNTIYFGQNAYGVKSAAKTYFNKELNELSIAECAAIAGITKNPYGYDLIRFPERNKERRLIVLGEMKKNGYITESEFQQAKNEEVTAYTGPGDTEENAVQSYFVDALIEQLIDDLMEQKQCSESIAKQMIYTGGLRVVTTIDLDVQAKMDSVFLDQENFPGKMGKNGTLPQASMVIMDPYTGHVLALYGGRGEKSGNRVLNRATMTKRQPGSSIKPLTVYAPGLEYGAITPISVLDDAPKDFSIKGSGWPVNETGSYGGRTTILRAVAKSLNPIAVEVLEKVGYEQAFHFARDNLGLYNLVDKRVTTNNKGEQTVYTDIGPGSLALGGLTDGLTVMEMTAAYSAFVNDGKYTRPVLYTRVYDANGNILIDNQPQQTVAMSSKTATYMVELLTNAVISGTGANAKLPGMQVGGKTGTTTSATDRWFAGITPYYVGVVWFGYDTPERISGVSINPALNLWKQVMEKVHEPLPNATIQTKTELRSVNFCADSGLRATEWCQKDIRGSRVVSAKVAPEDVPKATCDLHVSVEWDTETNGVANEFCPVDKVTTIGILNIQRLYPSKGVVVGDQAYVMPYEATDGLYPAISPQGTPHAPVCTVHNEENDGNAPEEPDPNDPNAPFDPNDPNAPYDPNDPNAPFDPNNPNVPADPNNPNVPSDPNNPNVPTDPNNPNVPDPPDPNVPNDPTVPPEPPEPDTPDEPEVDPNNPPVTDPAHPEDT